MVKRPLQLVTNSQLRTFRRCAVEHHYAYELGFRPRASSDEALRFGSLLHVGLEAWWRAWQCPGEQLDAALEAVAPLALDDYDLARVTALLQGYDARWSQSDEVTVLGVELEFRLPMLNPATGAASKTFELGGKLDALVVNHGDGLVYVVEHKSSAEDIGPGSAYWQRLQLDSQVSTYVEAARTLGHDVAGCLYDVVGKPGLRPHRATPIESRKYTKDGRLYANQRAEDETADDFYARLVEHVADNPERIYQRGIVVRTADEARAAAFDAWLTARQMRELQLANARPRNVASCERYGRLCPYFRVCTGQAALDDGLQFERLEWPHTELTPPNSEVVATA